MKSWSQIIWSEDPRANIDKVLEHGLTPSEIDAVLTNPTGHGVSRSSRRSILFGYTPDGRYITVIYEEIDRETVYPITAFEVEEPA